MIYKGYTLNQIDAVTVGIFSPIGTRLVDCGSFDLAKRTIDDRINSGRWNDYGMSAKARAAEDTRVGGIAPGQISFDEMMLNR